MVSFPISNDRKNVRTQLEILRCLNFLVQFTLADWLNQSTITYGIPVWNNKYKTRFVKTVKDRDISLRYFQKYIFYLWQAYICP